MGCPRLAVGDVIGIAVLGAIVSNGVAAFRTVVPTCVVRQSSPPLVLRRSRV